MIHDQSSDGVALAVGSQSLIKLITNLDMILRNLVCSVLIG